LPESERAPQALSLNAEVAEEARTLRALSG
jgi:hypothetical protein